MRSKNQNQQHHTLPIKALAFGILVLAALSFAFLGKSQKDSSNTASTQGANVTIENGVQIVTITAKGGYTPKASTAKAGIPTTLRFSTAGTFDCSSSVSIPSLNISQALARSGNTDIALGTQPAGVLQGSCSMGMYHFQVNFQG